MADANQNKAYQEALKQLDNMIKKQDALKKTTESLNNSWNAISSELFKMDGAQFFNNIAKSPEQLRQMGKEIVELESQFTNLGNEFEKALSKDINFQNIQKQLSGIGDEFRANTKSITNDINTSFSAINSKLDAGLQTVIKSEKDLEDILKGRKKLTDDQLKSLRKIQDFNDLETKFQIKSTKYQTDLEKKLKIFKQDNSEIALMNDDIVKSMISQLTEGKQLSELLATANDEERKFLAALSSNPEMLNDINKGMTMTADQVSRIKKESQEMNKEFSLSKGIVGALNSASSGLGSIIKRDWVGSMMKFDDVLNEVQKDTSINMDLNKTAFAELNTEVSQFGVSVEQAGKLVGDMSKELNTTNFGVLSQAAKDFSAIEGATGAAAGDITNIAGELMRMGESSGQVKDFMEGADQEARKFGVSSSKVLGGISRNIKKMREMGFTGGEKSLTKMAITAERLRMNMDETFDMAKRARSIEGAMDMAAELQLAGGSFANINPMDLLSAARKGPAELQKILTTMGKDIGHFDEETKKFQFDPVDVDRLQMVSDATGQSMESLQNMIEKNAEDIEKINPFQGMIDGLDEADKDLAKSALSDMLKRGKDGKMTIDVDNDMAKKMGVKDLAQITPEIMQNILKQKQADALSLEEQNKRNQSMKKSFDNFINALMSVFAFFQPAIEFLTEILQGVTSVFTTIMGFLPGWSKALLGGLILFGAMFGTSVGAFIAQGIGGFLKGVGGFAKSTIDFVKQVAAGEGGGAIGKLSSGIKSKLMGSKGVAENAMDKGSAIASDKTMTPAAGAEKKGFLMGLAQGIQEFGKVKYTDILKFALSLGTIGLAIIGFGIAMAKIGGEAGAAQMVTAAVSLGLLMGAIFVLSKIAGQVDMGGVLKGALAMLVVGASIIPFAFGAQMLTGVDWMSVLAGIGILTLVVFGLMGLGMLMAGPQIIFLLIGVGVLIAVGAALLIAASGLLLAAQAFQQLGAVDWTAFSGMGEALMSVVPGLLGFSFAAMMFMNPLTLLGMLFMTTALAGLAAIMIPLSMSLDLGATSLDRFASGLDKLGAAADKLSLDKLEKLKEFSDAMANASSGAAMAEAMANMTSKSSGGKSSGDGEVRKILVDVKINGRDLQNFIVKDTAIIK